MQTTPISPIHRHIELVLLGLAVLYMALCVPDLAHAMKVLYVKDAAVQRLQEAASKTAIGSPSFQAPYPSGKVSITQTGHSVVLTSRSNTGKSLCLVKDSTGTLYKSWTTEYHDDCPLVGTMALPKNSPVADSAGCADAKCLLARVELAVWKCAENSGTMEGCATPAKLIAVGELDPLTPLMASSADLQAGAVKVNSAMMLSGDSMYSIMANDGDSTWTLSYLSSHDPSARLVCAGKC